MARKWMLLSSLLSNGTIYVLLPAAIIWISRGQNVVNIVVNLLFYILFATYSSMQLAKLMLSAESVFQADLVMSKLDEIMSVKPLEYGVQSTRTKYDVKFENISFTYPTAESEAVENISFEIKQGQRVALVGESGGGKSTLAQLLPRFYEPDQGKITIDGVNIKEFSQEALMEQISFIFQNQTLFKISVLDNLLQAKPDATENEILTACAKAQCLDVVQNLPQGLNTVVGGQGVFLSGGEQQRILIAKAFLKDAPIIVLDEATAFTDPENEHLILKAFRELMENKTVLMIAHRLNSIIDCDQILVVERGEIVEQGKHQELIDLDATYAAMWSDYQLASDWRLNY
jgi:ATP-binding cassette subfamily B protein